MTQPEAPSTQENRPSLRISQRRHLLGSPGWHAFCAVTWCPQRRTPWGLFPTQSDASGCGHLPAADRAKTTEPLPFICAALKAFPNACTPLTDLARAEGRSFGFIQKTQTSLESENSDLLTPPCAGPTFTAGLCSGPPCLCHSLEAPTTGRPLGYPHPLPWLPER